ncbi:MAG: EAL domain-containing protein [Eubacteriales bacterium]|nr:EAL domain-containing protein [Eubacteriales bacterium]
MFAASAERVRLALEQEELELYYQPQIDVRTGRIVGMEALLRWRHPEAGMIGPAEFLAATESTDLIVEIGEWAVRTACQQNRTWMDGGYRIPVAVNVSAHQLENSDIVSAVRKALDESGLPPEHLEIEITENVAIHDFPAVIETMERLKGLGVRLAMDDFGTEYASLKYIQSLPVDTVKIDKCFVDGIEGSLKSRIVLNHIIRLSAGLGLEIVAEGVETKQQAQFLSAEGCRVMQGFYFYRPMPACEVRKIVRINEKSRCGDAR